jgi:hypothetical protein
MGKGVYTPVRYVEYFHPVSIMARQFELKQNERTLAEGCVFSDGRVCMRWLGTYSSIVIWNSIDEMIAINVIDFENIDKRCIVFTGSPAQ